MVSEVSGAGVAQAAHSGAAAHSLAGAQRSAYYGLAVIIFATALNFMDAQIFQHALAQHIKADFFI